MRLECDGNGLAAISPGTCHNLSQHFRVRAMYAVKIPHADKRRAVVDRDIVGFVEDQQVISGQWLVVSNKRPAFSTCWPLVTHHWPLNLKLQLHPVIRESHVAGQRGVGCFMPQIMANVGKEGALRTQPVDNGQRVLHRRMGRMRLVP